MGFLERLGLRQNAPEPILERGSPGTSVHWPAAGGYVRNWWQLGRAPANPRDALGSSAVYSCVAVISQECARLKVFHYRETGDGGRARVTSSPAARVMRRPNHYQTNSDFWLGFIAATALSGNGYAWAERDPVGRIMALHPLASDSVSAQVDPSSGAVFYRTGVSPLAPRMPRQVPARDMAHLRLFTGSDPLVGISPLEAASYSMAFGEQIQRSQVGFWGNQSRPSGILSTERPLSPDAARRLRDQWQASNSSDNAGKVAVLDSGMAWTPLSMSAKDSAMIESFNLTTETIAAIYRVPLFMINRLPTVSFNSVETMNRTFYSGTLASWLEAAEAVLDRIFNLPPSEAIEFDIETGLMQSNTADRLRGWKDGIQGGVLTPNEARRREKLPDLPGGDVAYLQAQMEPLEQRSAPEPETEAAPAPASVAPDPAAAERVAKLEADLARQRLLFAHEAGSLRADLARAVAGEGEPRG